jgi:hypothetical protein
VYVVHQDLPILRVKKRLKAKAMRSFELRLGELLQKLHDRRRRFMQPGFLAIDSTSSPFAVKPELGGKSVHREVER